MSKVVVIGAGASGIIAALKASERHDVILVDGNASIGKKILLTGNGRCNYWNEDIDIKNYHTDNKLALDNILCKKNEVLLYLKELCIFPKIKNGYYYPYSNQASSIREIFARAIELSTVEFIPNFKVNNIDKLDNIFIVSSNDTQIKCDKVIIATGSLAYPKTGTDGLGLIFAESFGHTINPVTPALTKLISRDSLVKSCENVRCDARLTLIIDDQNRESEEGELQITKNGISGIVTYNISSEASRALYNNNNVYVSINFLPRINDFYNWFNELNEAIPNKTLEEMFESLFNYKLMYKILDKADLRPENRWKKLTTQEKIALANAIENYKIRIVDTDSFDNAQVATGGVSLDEIKPTMESEKIKNLYMVGELLDVDGKCGGFNLAFAFISGYIAGENI